MPKIQFELTSTPITSHVGLTFIGQALDDPVLTDDINGLCSLPRNKNYISTLDTIKAMIGLLSVGKPQFDAIAEYRADPVFATALGKKRLLHRKPCASVWSNARSHWVRSCKSSTPACSQLIRTC